LAFASADTVVEGGLEPSQARIVETDVAEDVRGELLLRVIPAALLVEKHPLKIERLHPPRLVWRDLPCEVNELLFPRQSFGHELALRRPAAVEHGAYPGRDVIGIVDECWIGSNRVGVDAVGEYVPPPIHNLAPLGGELDGPELLTVGARHHVGVLDDLEVHE